MQTRTETKQTLIQLDEELEKRLQRRYSWVKQVIENARESNLDYCSFMWKDVLQGDEYNLKEQYMTMDKIKEEYNVEVLGLWGNFEKECYKIELKESN